MWDGQREMGVLNDFDLARFADQTGPSGHDNTGTLPFMALDLLSYTGTHGGIPRRYRHDAEAFAWTLIYLCLVTVKDKKGGNFTISPNPLPRWFENPGDSLYAKKGLEFDRHDDSRTRFAYPKAWNAAKALHSFWVRRYDQQFPKVNYRGHEGIERLFRNQTSNPPATATTVQPYEEPADETIFAGAISAFAGELDLAASTLAFEMTEKYQSIRWESQV